MNNNMSPWLYQLIHKRSVAPLHDDTKTDIAIVGAGIAGIMTAYFLLKKTDLQIVLVEAYKVAHGATGHNAGQIIAEFEREFHDIAREFGLKNAVTAEKSINYAWILIEEVFQEANLSTPFSTFMGYNGYETINRLMDELKNNDLRREADQPLHDIFIAEGASGLEEIPEVYRGLYNVIPHADVMDLLETDNKTYVAAMSIRKGCINGAMLCEEIVGFMQAKYPGRFILAEHTPIKEIVLGGSDAEIITKEHSIHADRVILCTNGFSGFKITNNVGGDIDSVFHHTLHGFVGYMAGYIEELNRQPNALGYYRDRSKRHKHHQKTEMVGDTPKVGEYYDDPYVYLTRRPYEIEKNERHNLVCIGGPEVYLSDTSTYNPIAAFDEKAGHEIGAFLKSTYRHVPKNDLEFKFTWHGLMGFTSNGIRLIGPEPMNPVLMYNLGCNGVGILPSIFGAYRISQYICKEEIEPMIFDPKRCDGGVC